MSHTATALQKPGPTQVMTDDAYCISLGPCASSIKHHSTPILSRSLHQPALLVRGLASSLHPQSTLSKKYDEPHHFTGL